MRALGSCDAQHFGAVRRGLSACREKLENVAKAIAHCDAHAFDLCDANVMFLLGAGLPPTIDASEPVEHSTKTAAVFSALMSLPKGVKLLARFARAMPATAAASPLLRAVLETPRALNVPYFVDHDEELHAALRATPSRRACRSRRSWRWSTGCWRRRRSPSSCRRATTSRARPDAEPKLADSGECVAMPFAS